MLLVYNLNKIFMLKKLIFSYVANQLAVNELGWLFEYLLWGLSMCLIVSYWIY
jgi:hypothetical protein